MRPLSVLLVNPPNKRKLSVFASTPLGLASLAASLGKIGVFPQILDAYALNYDIQETIKVIAHKRPDVIGLSSTTDNLKVALELARLIKLRIRSVIVVGGPHATLDPKSLAQFGFIDYIFSGEAEITFPEVIFDISKKKIAKKIILCKVPEDLNALPYPMYDLLPMQRYFLPYTSKTPAYIEASRGCIFSCSFCSIKKTSVRVKSPVRILNEMMVLKKLGVNYAQFSDESFTYNRSNVISLCDMIICKKLRIEWGCQTRCDLIDRDLAKKMKAAGCSVISFGVESALQSVRNLIGKSFSENTILQSFKICSESGIQTIALFIIGLSGDIQTEIKMNLALGKRLRPNYCLFSPPIIYPHTRLTQIKLKERGLTAEEYNREIFDSEFPFYAPKGYTKEQFIDTVSKINYNYYFRPSFIAKKFCEIKSKEDLKRYFYYIPHIVHFLKSKTR